MAENFTTLGERLAWGMKQAEITQGYLADQVGVTQALVSQWCTGKKTPSTESLQAMARLLRLNPVWIEDGVGPVRVADLPAERSEYKRHSFWGFRRAAHDGGRDFGNANVWSFDPTIEVLVREVLQNALDAVLPGGGVSVKFRLIELRGSDLVSYQDAVKWQELKHHLEASTQNRQKLGSLIRDGLDSLTESSELMLLVIEDSGTSGLVGSEAGDGKFAALCRNNLDSNKEGAPTKGGAFGLGKGVLWRASRFATVMFCSNLSQPVSSGERFLRILGRCDLPWHELPGKSFAGPGWFGRLKNEEQDLAVSFWDNEALARDLYLFRDRVGSGTSVCVVGFHDPSSDKPKSARELGAEIENAAAQHFFPAMAAGKLKVSIETYGGRVDYDAATPASAFDVDVKRLQPEYSHILESFREGAFADSLVTPGDVVCKRVSLSVPARRVNPKHSELEHNALLIVRYHAEEEAGTPPNRMAVFRGPGMVVSEHNLSGICLGSRPFHALLLCGLATSGESQAPDLAAEEFLRTAEPPSHNKWAATPELKAAYARGCVSKLLSFLDEAKSVLREVVKPVSRDLGNGPNSLRELFRIGSEPMTIARERPRVVEQHGHVEGDGREARWRVEARIRLKPSDRETVLVPAVVFVAETGGGTAVRWQHLEALSNCTVNGYELRIPPRRREISFRGMTDPASHPVPAHDSSVVVDIRKVLQLVGGKP